MSDEMNSFEIDAFDEIFAEGPSDLDLERMRTQSVLMDITTVIADIGIILDRETYYNEPVSFEGLREISASLQRIVKNYS